MGATSSTTFFVSCLAVFFAALIALVTGQSWLGTPDPIVGIPLGNLLAATMMACLPLAALAFLKDSVLRWPAIVLAVLGLFWLPISILLAGNVYLSHFSGWAFRGWLIVSAICLLLPVALMLAGAVIREIQYRDH